MLIMAVIFWTEKNHLFFAGQIGQIGVAPKKCGQSRKKVGHAWRRQWQIFR